MFFFANVFEIITHHPHQPCSKPNSPVCFIENFNELIIVYLKKMGSLPGNVTFLGKGDTMMIESHISTPYILMLPINKQH